MTASLRPLQDRTAVVTGAARGLGAAMARELARRGASVALLGREESTLAKVRDALPGPARCWEVDVTDDEAMRRVAAEVRDTLGPASIVIANAGVAEGGPFAESDPSLWRRVVEVNLVGSANTARVFLPDLRASRGYYLQIASLASIGAAPMMSAYCASKAGVESFAHSLRAEVAHEGVDVGIAYLNWTDTDMIRDADHHPVLRELRAHMPKPARKVYPVEMVADRMVRAVERRSAAVYAPAWLRATQPVRAAMPPVVTFLSKRELPRLQRRFAFEPTGPLGAGGRADAAGTRRTPPPHR
ncbi:SDR family oxidoreductase [Streptomyces sp. NPDC054838]